jgi:RimJ/RimL family protein N-acetyltransferase
MVADDAEAYREIRLEALASAPAAFGGSYASTAARTMADWIEMIEKSTLFAAIAADGTWAGTAGFFRHEGEKTQHRGTLFGMYVRPTFRGTGCSSALIETVLDHARSQVIQVHLSVAADNDAAIKAYQRAGFTTYGTDPRGLHVDGRYIDEHLMVRFLEGTEKVTDNE